MAMAPAIAQLVLLGMLLAVAWDTWQGMRPGAWQPAPSKMPESAPTLPPLQALADVALFGKVKEKKAKPTHAEVVVRSPLKLEVLGIVGAGEKSAAILKVNGKQQVFVVGDRIQPGVILRRVENDAIVVEHNGQLERVEMPHQRLTGEAG